MKRSQWRGEEVDLPELMKWQAANHRGFVHAFVNSFRDGPIYGREEEWRRVGKMGLGLGMGLW